MDHLNLTGRRLKSSVEVLIPTSDWAKYKEHPFYSGLFKLAAWLIRIFGINTCINIYASSYHWALRILLIYICYWFTFLPARFLNLFALVHGIPHLHQLLKDTRPPILYLHDFDGTDLEGDSALSAKLSAESRIISAFKDVGPVISVANPNSSPAHNTRLRPRFLERWVTNRVTTGRRVLLRETEDWHDQVKHLMSISQLVIINIPLSGALSEGLKWETLTAREMLKPEKVIFSFLGTPASYGAPEILTRILGIDPESEAKLLGWESPIEFEEFNEYAEKVLRLRLPEKINDAVFVYCDGGWAVHPIRVGVWKRLVFGQGYFRTANGISVIAIREALRPLLKSRGVKLSVTPTLIRIPQYVSLIFITALFIYLLIFRPEDSVVTILFEVLGYFLRSEQVI